MIEVKNISVVYPDGYRALHKVSFTVDENETTAVIGSNGAGKSTLLRAIMGLILMEEGSIRIGNIDVEKKNLPLVRKEAGLIFQNPDDQIFNTKVMDDIYYGPKNAGMNKGEMETFVGKIIKDLKMEEIQDKLTHKLSGGEKRLVSIAGVLVMNPKVLLMDEPTSFLDPRARRNFIELIGKLYHTKLIVTHDLDMVLDLCDKVILMEKGEIVTSGIPDVLLRDRDLLEMYGLELPLCFQYEKYN